MKNAVKFLELEKARIDLEIAERELNEIRHPSPYFSKEEEQQRAQRVALSYELGKAISWLKEGDKPCPASCQ